MKRGKKSIYWKIWNNLYPNNPIVSNSNECIHHIDGDCYNNDPNNLVKLDKKLHSRLHGIKRSDTQAEIARTGWTDDRRKEQSILIKKLHRESDKFKNKKRRDYLKLNYCRRKQSNLQKGTDNNFYGIKHTEESKKLISLNHANVKGINNPRAKPLYINYVFYQTIKDAHNSLRCYPKTIKHIIYSGSPGCFFVSDIINIFKHELKNSIDLIFRGLEC